MRTDSLARLGRSLRWLLALPVAACLAACFAPLEGPSDASARVMVQVSAQDDGLTPRTLASSVGGTVDLQITGLRAGQLVPLARSSFKRDSIASSLDVRVDLTPCLDFTVSSPACPLLIKVYLRDNGGVAYDSTDAGPVIARPGAVIDVPALTFRPTASLVVVDTLVRVLVGRQAIARINSLDARGVLLQGRPLTWRSLNTTVATVAIDGTITAVTPGQTTLEATRDGKVGVVRVIVPSVETITLSATSFRLVLSQPAKLTTTITVAPGRSTRFVYSSSNPAIVTVDSTGTIATVGEGTAQIFITPDADPADRRSVSVTVDPFRSAIAWQSLVTGSQGPLPGTVTGLYGTRPDSLIAASIGTGCFLSRFNGVSWRLEASGPICARAFTGTSMSDMWAVGNGIQSWNGTTWVRDPVTFTGTLMAATTVQGTNFAVGTGGLIMRRTGGAWSQMTSPTTQTLRAVSALSPTLVYAVGDSGTVVRFNGTSWTRLPPLSRVNLFSVLVRSPTEVYATGNIGAPYLQETLRFDGATWTVVPVEDISPMYVLFAVGSDLYVAGFNGIVMRLEAGRFVRRSPNAGLTNVVSAWSNGTYTMLAGESGYAASFQPDVPTTLNFVPSYLGMWGASPNAIWAVGLRGGVDFFNGSTWSSIRGDNVQSLTSIFGFDANTVWAGGTRGTMLRLQGGTFTPVQVPVGSWITSIWGAHPDSLWAVTDGAQFLRWNGATWAITHTAPSSLRGVHGSSGRAATAVGNDGVIMRWNGSNWTRETSGISSELYGIFAPDSSFAVAVGDSAVLVRVNGTWQNITAQFGSVAPFFRVATGSSRRDVVIGGCAGIWRFDGTTWVRETLATPVCINSGFAFPGGGMVAGSVLRNIYIGTGPRGNRPGLPP